MSGTRVSTLPTATAPGTFYVIEGGVSKKIVLGTMSTQNANAVAITGGAVSGLSGLDVAGNAGLSGGGTSQRFLQITNTGGQLYIGKESSVAGAFFVGSSAYASVYYNNNSAPHQFIVGGVNRAEITSTGLNATAYSTNGAAVVGTRKTGWAAATGTATRTTFATSTVTLPQLAERVKALLDDLISHGLIGA